MSTSFRQAGMTREEFFAWEPPDERAEGVHAWTAASLVAEDILQMPEIGIEIPVAEFCARIGFEAAGGGA